MDGCYRALRKLRDEGAVKAIGFGVNNLEVMLDFMQQGDFDTLLLAGRNTLLEQQPLDELLPLREKRKTAVVIVGGFNSGILATGAAPGGKMELCAGTRPHHEKSRED